MFLQQVYDSMSLNFSTVYQAVDDAVFLYDEYPRQSIIYRSNKIWEETEFLKYEERLNMSCCAVGFIAWSPLQKYIFSYSDASQPPPPL